MNNLELMNKFLFDLDVGYGFNRLIGELDFTTNNKVLIKKIKQKAKDLGLSCRKKGSYYIIRAK